MPALRFEPCTAYGIAEVLHEACEQTDVYRGKTSKESVLLGLAKFDCYAITREGELIGGIIFRGTECHIGILAAHHKNWATREVYRFFERQATERGVIQAKCGNPLAMPFIQRLVERGYVCLNES